MAALPSPIKQVIQDYVTKISSQIPVEKVILFGSYAKGTFDSDSDIDIAIFSNHFRKMDEIEGFRFLFTQAMDYDADLQPLAFTMEDYENPMGSVEEILKTGIEIS